MKNIDFKNNRVIVFGLGITGKSSVKALLKLGFEVSIYDDKNYDENKGFFEEIKSYSFNIIKEYENLKWENYDVLLKSPGIKNSNKFLVEARKNNLEIISDIELAYRLYGGDKFITITGTNGKTTTCLLITHILNTANIKSKATGNIGESILQDMLDEDTQIFVIEASSFQLDAIDKFRSKISVITNVSEDHIDWHGSFELYKDSKFKIFKNLLKTDLLILNKDDEELNSINLKSRIEYFSLENNTDAFYRNNRLIYKNNGEISYISRDIIKLVGNHNIANILAALLAVKEFNIDNDTIIEAIETFSPIEHRIEYVTTINGIKYYNDSKGTNINSTKMALKGFKNEVLLIAGGYDKGGNFDDLFEGNSNIKTLIVYGENKEKIIKSSKKYGIETQ